MDSLAKIDIIQKDDLLVVDSRLIADELEIQHKNLLATIKKYVDEIQEFGHLAFETETVTNSIGARNTTIFCYLNEEQATYLMTLSKNTNQVRRCKRSLVKAFSQAKTIIKTVIPQQSERIRELELQNEVLDKQLSLRQLDHTMLTLHGAPTVLALRGMADQVVEVKTVVTEVIDEKTGAKFKGATLKQMADILKERFGIKFKSGAELERHLESLGRSDLIAQMKRPVLSPYIPEEFMDEAIKVIRRNVDRQMLLGE